MSPGVPSAGSGRRPAWPGMGLSGFALALLGLVTFGPPLHAERELRDIDQPPHEYAKRTPRDPFSRIMGGLASGEIALDRTDEKRFLTSLLSVLGVPASSQMLVFSTTSLQLSLISPANPRALYFNDEVYVGYIPGGRIEIVSVDPEWGGIFYIFDIPREGRPLQFERSDRCMNCHARDDTGQVPGLVVKSVIPGTGGGSLTAYRIGQSGHTIPLEQRFGGWHVTGADSFTNHHGNVTGTQSEGKLTKIPNPPGVRFRWDRYLVPRSDLLPQLVHEHQVGFANRVAHAAYLTREILTESAGQLSAAQAAEMDEAARNLTRYLLFADEAPLPAGGVAGDADFKADFLRHRRTAPDGESLKDFDLTTRLFRHRCSYLIYAPSFAQLPAVLKQRVYQHLGRVLRGDEISPDFAYLPVAERQSIRTILKATLTDLPAGW